MTFKLSIGKSLQRGTPAPSNNAGTDLVRQFRARMREEAEAAKANPKQRSDFLPIRPTRVPR